MKVLGWLSILIGLLHFRKASGILLTVIGIAVIYVVWKSKKNEIELTHRVFQAEIKMTRRIKKVQGIAKEQSKSNFLINALPTQPDLESKEKNIQKSDWFIYTK